MKNLQKTVFTPYPELFTFLDRFCPMCGSPVSVKRTEKLEALVCTDPKCPYYQLIMGKKGERKSGPIEC